MSAIDIITKKRDGQELTREEVHAFIEGIVSGAIPDYQIAAWLMAVYLRGMTLQETINLTFAMAHSGTVMDLADVAPFVVDKHSTGGVGDKTTLVVAPLVASTGLPVGKISGRGLSFTGGTVDKLESVPGLRCNLTVSEFKKCLRAHGIAVSGQSHDLAPADGILYALRDVTATVSSLPLIASSIMSKKIAAGANGIVLDVKVGHGAFSNTLDDADALATLMVNIGLGMGRKMAAVLSNMDQPLGHAVGNALEVVEAVDTLRGRGPADLVEQCLTLATQMLLVAGRARSEEEALELLQDSLSDGLALEKFREWVKAQGGDPRVADNPGDVLPAARFATVLRAESSGWVCSVNALEIGLAALSLGAGRTKKGETIDPSVGIVLHRKTGDQVQRGDPLCTVHSSMAPDCEHFREVLKRIGGAYQFSRKPVSKPKLILKILSP